MNSLLNCLDRLEVRGRDSAGIQISFVPADAGAVGGAHGRPSEQAGSATSCDRRMDAGDLVNGSITCAFERRPRGNGAGGRSITFTYKTASIIGELGRNVRELRSQIAQDRLFHAFARLPVAFETAFAHTRWASVGSITEENCHPLEQFHLFRGSAVRCRSGETLSRLRDGSLDHPCGPERGHRQLSDPPGGRRGRRGC